MASDTRGTWARAMNEKTVVVNKIQLFILLEVVLLEVGAGDLFIPPFFCPLGNQEGGVEIKKKGDHSMTMTLNSFACAIWA